MKNKFEATMRFMTTKESKRGRTRTRSASQQRVVRALERGLILLELLGKNHEISLSDISRQSELNCSTAFRLLETLRQRGYVRQDESSGLYGLGAGAMALGTACAENLPLPRLANAPMQKLVHTTEETANLAVLGDSRAVYVHQVEAQRSVRMFTQLGAHVPIHCTGVGKVLVAWWSKEKVLQLLDGVEFESFTENTISDIDQLEVELASVRRLGYGIDDEEREEGVRCVTAPVRDARGEVIAALSISAPISRLPKKLIATRAKQIQATAAEISKQLGFTG